MFWCARRVRSNQSEGALPLISSSTSRSSLNRRFLTREEFPAHHTAIDLVWAAEQPARPTPIGRAQLKPNTGANRNMSWPAIMCRSRPESGASCERCEDLEHTDDPCLPYRTDAQKILSTRSPCPGCKRSPREFRKSAVDSAARAACGCPSPCLFLSRNVLDRRGSRPGLLARPSFQSCYFLSAGFVLIKC